MKAKKTLEQSWKVDHKPKSAPKAYTMSSFEKQKH